MEKAHKISGPGNDSDLEPPGSSSTSSTSSTVDSDREPDDLQDDCEDVHEIFDTIRKALTGGAIDLSNSHGLKKFKDTYKDSLGRLTSEKTQMKQTLLHVLVVDASDEAFERYKPLVKLIIEEYPGILKEQDASSRTSLYHAIGLKCNKLVEYICDTYAEINSVLEQACTVRKETCIHAAIYKGMDTEPTIKLINRASPRILCMQDSQGNTALHSAVKYELCSEEQLRIVQTLAERGGSEAMKKRNDDSFSPYLYHMHTRPKAIEAIEDTAANIVKEKTKHDTRGKRLNSNFPSLEGGKPTHLADSKGPVPLVASSGLGELAFRKPYNKSSIVRRSSSTIQVLPMNNDKPSLAYIKSDSLESAVQSPRELRETPNDYVDKDPKIGNKEVTEQNKTTSSKRGKQKDKEKEKETGEQKEKKKKKEKSKKTEKGKDLKKGADKVENFLLLHCMRTLKKKDAEDFLYGETQGKEICFDLSNQSRLNITQDRIHLGYQILQFERILKYVAFPKVQIEKRSVPAHKGKPPKPDSKTDGKGRNDMTFMFDFLRNKGVKRIIRVVVADQEGIAHSDEAIERALSGFEVEIWDWQRFDICTETIAWAAPGVEQAHLYWSGNNAVLWGWSEENVLDRMTRLKKVYLHTTHGLETTHRMTGDVTKFKKRMELRKVDVELIDEEQPQQHEINKAHTEAELERRHQWLICMDEFADFIQALKPTSPSYKPITIALIDDGVDMTEETLHSRVLQGKSFSLGDEINQWERPYYESGGHGTAMASLICRVCPNATIIPLRLEEYPGIEDSKRQITAQSAVEALTYAVKRKPDIISMSWTIKKTDDNASHIEDLEKIVKKAAKNGILMFCAASDGGAVTDQTFPAESQRELVFKIGAATEEGKAWKWVGDDTRIDFIFPGFKVVQERYEAALLKKCNILTGSSVATALAAGLAALVLDCVQIAAFHYEELLEEQKKLSESSQEKRAADFQRFLNLEKVLPDDYVKFKNTREMKAAFNRIGVTEGKYVKVWELFQDGPRKASGIVKGERTETVIAELNLVAKRLKG